MESKESMPTGTQTLLRGLSVLAAVAKGTRDLKMLSQTLGLARSTTHRLVTCLIQERFLRIVPGRGYELGPRLIELGYQAREALPLTAVAKPFIQGLVTRTSETVHLGIREDSDVLYVDKISGLRGLEVRSRIGTRLPLIRTGIGKALILDLSEAQWRVLFNENPLPLDSNLPPDSVQWSWDRFLVRMREYAAGGYALDLEDNEFSIRCVAVPIRDVGGDIIAAISVTSTVHHLPMSRMHELIPILRDTADRITRELGG